jgi:hypothetical protein
MPSLPITLAGLSRPSHTELTVQLPATDPTNATPRCDLVMITRQICAGLRSSGLSLILLSGRWAAAAVNFVLTFAGSVPFNDLLREQAVLLQAFPEGHLILLSGLLKVTFNRVPTKDPETEMTFLEGKLLR